MSALLDWLASLDLRVLLVATGAFMVLETTLFVGLLIPGDVVVLLAGAAMTEPAEYAVLVAVVTGGSLIGETVGYLLGRRYGDRVRHSRLGGRLGKHRWARAESFLNGRGGRALIAARFVAVVHATAPVVAGAARMPYRRFIAWTGAGSLLWAVLFVSVGAAAARVQVLVIALAIALGCVMAVRHVRRGRHRPAGAGPVGAGRGLERPVDVDAVIRVLHAAGLSAPAIWAHLEVPADRVRQVTRLFDGEVRTWRSRPLGGPYAELHLERIPVRIHDGDADASHAAMVAVGVRPDGCADVVGLRLDADEAETMAELRRRGLDTVAVPGGERPSSVEAVVGELRRAAAARRCLPHERAAYALMYVAVRGAAVRAAPYPCSMMA